LMVTGKTGNRDIRAFYDARLYKSDLSGKADSIHSNEVTGLTKLIRDPILWSGESQITGDTIHLISNTETEQLDSLKVFYNAFMIQKDSIEGYNQIKGKELYGLFRDNEIYEVNIIRNTESLFFLRDDTSDLLGINKSISAKIKILLEKQEIVDVYYYNEVDSKTYPSSMFPDNARKLKDFSWRGDERLTSKADLFEGRDSLVLPKIKGLEDPEIYDDFFEGIRELNSNSNLEKANLKPSNTDEVPEDEKLPLRKIKAVQTDDEK